MHTRQPLISKALFSYKLSSHIPHTPPSLNHHTKAWITCPYCKCNEKGILEYGVIIEIWNYYILHITCNLQEWIRSIIKFIKYYKAGWTFVIFKRRFATNFKQATKAILNVKSDQLLKGGNNRHVILTVRTGPTVKSANFLLSARSFNLDSKEVLDQFWTREIQTMKLVKTRYINS